MHGLCGACGGSRVFCSAPPSHASHQQRSLPPACYAMVDIHPTQREESFYPLVLISGKTEAGRKKVVFFSPLLSFFSWVTEPGSVELGLLAQCPVRSQLTDLSMGLKRLFPFPPRTGSLTISSLEFK